MLSQLGMSMIEIMMAVGMLSVISLGIMSMSKNMTKASKTASKNFDIETVMREIQSHMSINDNCTATVLGASGSGDTVVTSMKYFAANSGSLYKHDRLKASTLTTPYYVSNGMIINGMYLNWVANTGNGASYELKVTFIKNVKEAKTAGAQITTYGPNIVTRKIPLQLDNCSRSVAVGNSQQAAAGQCTSSGGSPGTEFIPIYSAAGAVANAMGVSDTQWFTSCRICAVRTTVNGCL